MYVYQIIVRIIQYAGVYLPLCPVRHCVVVVAAVNVRLTDMELRIYYYYHHYWRPIFL